MRELAHAHKTRTIKTKIITLLTMLMLVGLTIYKMNSHKFKTYESLYTHDNHDILHMKNHLNTKARTIDEIYKQHKIQQTPHALLHNFFMRTEHNATQHNTHEDEYIVAYTITEIRALPPLGHYFAHALYKQLPLLEIVCFMQYTKTFMEYKIHFLNIEHMCYMYVDIITSLTAHMRQEQKQVYIVSSLLDMLSTRSKYKHNYPQIYACMVLEFVFNGKRNMYLQPYKAAQSISNTNKYYIQHIFHAAFHAHNINTLIEIEDLWCKCMLQSSYAMLHIYDKQVNYYNEFLAIFFNTLCKKNISKQCAYKLQQSLPHIQHMLHIRTTQDTQTTHDCVIKVTLNMIQDNSALFEQYVTTLRTCTPQIIKDSDDILTDEQVNLINIGNRLLHVFYKHMFNMNNTKINKHNLHAWLYDSQFKASTLQQAYHYCRVKDEDSKVAQKYYVDLYNHLIHKTQIQYRYTELRLYTQLNTKDQNLTQHDDIRLRLINCFRDIATFRILLQEPQNANNVWRQLLE